jgi:hypothetical protein
VHQHFTIHRRYFLLKIWTLFMNILYNTLKWEGTRDHFRRLKIPGTTPYWKAWQGSIKGAQGRILCDIHILPLSYNGMHFQIKETFSQCPYLDAILYYTIMTTTAPTWGLSWEAFFLKCFRFIMSSILSKVFQVYHEKHSF